jgi:hypothetical protein
MAVYVPQNAFNLQSVDFNPLQPSDAIWRHTFHLSLICMSFAQ